MVWVGWDLQSSSTATPCNEQGLSTRSAEIVIASLNDVLSASESLDLTHKDHTPKDVHQYIH